MDDDEQQLPHTDGRGGDMNDPFRVFRSRSKLAEPYMQRAQIILAAVTDVVNARTASAAASASASASASSALPAAYFGALMTALQQQVQASADADADSLSATLYLLAISSNVYSLPIMAPTPSGW